MRFLCETITDESYAEHTERERELFSEWGEGEREETE
jgi:hypothetical protein